MEGEKIISMNDYGYSYRQQLIKRYLQDQDKQDFYIFLGFLSLIVFYWYMIYR